jgi:hypothetical protein
MQTEYISHVSLAAIRTTYAAYVSVFLVAVASLLLMPAVSLAADIRSGDSILVSASSTVVGNAYFAGGSITSNSKISGDLVAAGGTIIVSGPVAADALLAGGTISVLSDISDDARIAGGNITITGSVARDLVVAGGQIHISGKGIGGDLLVGGGEVTIDAPVKGNVRIGGGKITINGEVGGNVEIMSDNITLGPTAIIAGDFTYHSSKLATFASGSQIKGKTNFIQTNTNRVAPAALAAFLTFWAIAKFFMVLIGALFVGLFFRRYALEVVTQTIEAPLKTVGLGLVVLIVLPIASLILITTIVGIPFGVLGVLGFIAILIFASLFVPVLLGALIWKLFRRNEEYTITWVSILVGVIAYMILSAIPIIGGLIKFVLILLVLGVGSSLKWQAIKEWR